MGKHEISGEDQNLHLPAELVPRARRYSRPGGVNTPWCNSAYYLLCNTVANRGVA